MAGVSRNRLLREGDANWTGKENRPWVLSYPIKDIGVGENVFKV